MHVHTPGSGPHQHAHASGPTAQRRLWLTLLVTIVIMVAEGVGGYVAGSLALVADAGHMLTDILALVVALAAGSLSALPADMRRTYGYRRLEVLAALINSVALVLVSLAIVYEAVDRWLHPGPIEAVTMMLVAGVGLIANLVSLRLLGHGHDNVNVRGAFLHILGDALSSAGVVVGGVIIVCTGWTRIDSVLSVLISIIIIGSSVGLLKEVVDVLLEAVPKGIDAEAVRQTLTGIAGVQQVHDLHIWSITAGMPALSAHVVVASAQDNTQALLVALRASLLQHYRIAHTTLQLETQPFDDCGCGF